jgi:hypothetical protein
MNIKMSPAEIANAVIKLFQCGGQFVPDTWQQIV